MSEWDKISNVFPDSIQEIWNGDSEGSKWLDDITTVGDKQQTDNEVLHDYNKNLEYEHTLLIANFENQEQKLEAIRKIVQVPDVWNIADPIGAIREVLGE